jgi:hypothetical protein
MTHFNFNLRFEEFEEILMRNKIMTFIFTKMIMSYSSVVFYVNRISTSAYRIRAQDLCKKRM